ncbi:MAG: voltage-gated potassium channel [Pseudonocardiales bacterium]|jgi:voltage-gated potassium channel|nr:voltage-gated potassium channel [Pseudonocardiales bacterium]
MTEEVRIARWDDRVEWVLATGAVAFLVAYAWPILQTDLASGVKAACSWVVLGTWILFGVDYVVRLALAQRRWTYWWRNLPYLAMVVLPVLRPLQLLRLVVLLRALNRRAASALRGRIAIYVGSATVLLVFTGALAELAAERGRAGATIESFGDALWWAASTITTVGYGDVRPVTTEGRFVAVGLMIGGIALLGTVTASIASWLVDRVRETEAAEQAATQHDVAALRDEIRQLRRVLEARQA